MKSVKTAFKSEVRLRTGNNFKVSGKFFRGTGSSSCCDAVMLFATSCAGRREGFTASCDYIERALAQDHERARSVFERYVAGDAGELLALSRELVRMCTR